MSDEPPRSHQSEMRRYLLLAAVSVNLVLIGLLVYVVAGRLTAPATGAGGGESSGAVTFYDSPRDVQDFTLTSHTGEPFSLHDLRGRMTVLFFGFTHCPDVCPLTLAEFKKVKLALGSEAGDVAFVFISVDGARDTPETLARYLGHFDADFIGLTGEETLIRRAGESFDLFFERREIEGSQASYTIDHTASSFLIDREGRLLAKIAFGADPLVIAAAIRERL